MAKKCYIGVGSLAHLAKKAYIGVDGVARKIKKGYIGVGGIAKLFFGAFKPKYAGELEELNGTKGATAAATTGNYAIFAGGFFSGSGNRTSIVESYDKNFVHAVLSALPATIANLSGGQIGGYALFAGGNADMYDNRKTVYVYDDSLTRTEAAELENPHNNNPPSAWNDNYAAFAGGHNNSGMSWRAVNFYSKSLVKSLANLNVTQSAAAGNRVGPYILFAGGLHTEKNSSGNYVDSRLYTVEAFDAALTHYNLPKVNTYTYTPAAVEGYAIFLPSVSVGAYAPEIYNQSLSKLAATSIKCPVNQKAVTLGDYALIVGGGTSNLMYSYNQSLTLQQQESFVYKRKPAGMTTVGDAAILAGGWEKGAKVEAYKLD